MIVADGSDLLTKKPIEKNLLLIFSNTTLQPINITDLKTI